MAPFPDRVGLSVSRDTEAGVDAENLIAKAAAILSALGATTYGALGYVIVFTDDVLAVESYCQGGLNMRIGYATSACTSLEVWHGDVLSHPGDHAVLHAYVDELFNCLGDALQDHLRG